MTKAQPKVSDLVEILLQEVIKLQKSVDSNNHMQHYISNKIDETIIKVDSSELQLIERQFQEKLQKDFACFNREIKRSNDSLLNLYNYINDNKILYLISLNIFLVLCTGISMFIAINKTVDHSHFKASEKDNLLLKGKLNNVKTFFDENPKVAKHYREWNLATEK